MEELLTTAEMAARTGFSESWFVSLRAKNAGPAFVRIGAGIGSSVRYRWSDWEAYLAANRVEPRGPYKKAGTS